MKAKFAIFMALILVLSFSAISLGISISVPGPKPSTSVPIPAPIPSLIESINAQLAKDMGFRVDGQKWQPKDTDGTILSPIIYKGRSYVPVRALLEEKNVKVAFDSNTRTIILNYPEPPPDPYTQVGPAGEPRDEAMWDHSDEDVKKEIVFALNMGEIGGPYREWILYDFPKNKRNTDGDNWPPSKHSVSFDLDKDSKIILNGKEQSLTDGIGSMSGGSGVGKAIYRISGGGGSGKAVFKDLKQSKAISSLELNGNFDESDVVNTNVVVEVVVDGLIITINVYY